MGTSYLIEKGQKEIGFVGSVYTTTNIRQRYLGFGDTFMEHGFAFDDTLLLETGRIFIF